MKSGQKDARSVAKKSRQNFLAGRRLETARLPHTPFLPVGRSGGPCPTVIAGTGRVSVQGSCLVRPKASQRLRLSL